MIFNPTGVVPLAQGETLGAATEGNTSRLWLVVPRVSPWANRTTLSELKTYVASRSVKNEKTLVVHC